jgi:transposase
MSRNKKITARPRRDFVALKRRRRRAVRLFQKKVKQAEVARLLEVSRQSVSRWYKEWKRGGADALKGAGRAGRKPKLEEAQILMIEQDLLKGARAQGFATELWTLKRVAIVIERVTGVRYHPGHVWRILRRRLGWTVQLPAKRARERSEEAVANWIKTTWPAIKKKRAKRVVGSSSRTKAASRSGPHSGARGRPRDRHR